MYFLEQKSEVFEIFKVFKDLVENLSGNNIKVLMNYNAKEYVYKDLQHLCDKNGIQMHHCTLHTTPKWCDREQE